MTNRLSHVSLIAACLAGVLTLNAPVHSADAVEAAVKVESLGGPLHLLRGKGGNVVASVGLDGVLLVDSDYADLGPAYEKALAGLTQSDIAPGFIINTHWHGDHTGSNEFWGNRGAVVVAHRNVRQRLSTTQDMKALGQVVEPSAPIAWPIVTFADSLALHFNGDDIEVQHFPSGHTDGDSVVFYSKENVVHTGDLFFKDSFPFVDLGSGGSIAGYIANVETLLGKLDDATRIVPGHGSLASKADFARYLAMLRETTSTVQTMLKNGKTIEQIVATGLGDKWVSWGKGFINEQKWIATIVASQ